MFGTYPAQLGHVLCWYTSCTACHNGRYRICRNSARLSLTLTNGVLLRISGRTCHITRAPDSSAVYVPLRIAVMARTAHHLCTFPCPLCLAPSLSIQGAFCPGDSNSNFTLCPLGTYQPSRGRSACLRCPIGFHCPERGMPVPRVCPAGRVCDVTGVSTPDQPCPEGHFCLEGTATTATTCGHPRYADGIKVVFMRWVGDISRRWEVMERLANWEPLVFHFSGYGCFMSDQC